MGRWRLEEPLVKVILGFVVICVWPVMTTQNPTLKRKHSSMAREIRYFRKHNDARLKSQHLEGGNRRSRLHCCFWLCWEFQVILSYMITERA